MPIKGLSENRRLPRLGKIHLGIKVQKGGKEYPRAVDYFVCPPEVQAVFGEQPRELRVLIPVEDEEKWCSQYYRLYSNSRGLVCKGDGERCMRLVDIETGDLAWKSDAKQVEMREMTCPGRDCPDYGAKCKEVMNLQFLLPEVPGLGIWQIDTGSVNSIRNINSAADLIKRLYGRISMIPLLLTVEPMEVKTPDAGKTKNVYVLNLRTRDTLVDMMQRASISTVEMLALPAGEGYPEDIETPCPDDENPELIIPQNQETAPTAEEQFEAIPSASEQWWPKNKGELRGYWETKRGIPGAKLLSELALQAWDDIRNTERHVRDAHAIFLERYGNSEQGQLIQEGKEGN